MNNRTLQLLKKGLVSLMVLCLLGGAVSLSESAQAQPAGRKTLFIGFNAGHHADEAEIQAYHEQATALMKLMLMLESPGVPSVNIHYVAGGTGELESRVVTPGSVSRFSWQSVKLLDELENSEYASRTGRPGWDLLYFLRDRAGDVPGAAEQGKVVLYWFDRFSAPNIASSGPQVAQYARQLNTILAQDNVEIYLAFAPDSDGRLEAFQTQVISSLTGSARVHVFTYGGDRSLESGLRQLNDREFGALYIGELSRANASGSAQMPGDAAGGAPEGTAAADDAESPAAAAEASAVQADDPRVREVSYDHSPVGGSGTMLLIRGDKSIADVQLIAEGEDTSVSPLVIRRGGEAFVFLTDQMPAGPYRVRITSAQADDSVTAAAFLLPGWRATVRVAEASDGNPLSLTRDARALTLLAGMPGLPQENVSIRMVVRYTSLEDRQYPGYTDFLAQSAAEQKEAFSATDEDNAAAPSAAEENVPAEGEDITAPADENTSTVEDSGETADVPAADADVAAEEGSGENTAPADGDVMDMADGDETDDVPVADVDTPSEGAAEEVSAEDAVAAADGGETADAPEEDANEAADDAAGEEPEAETAPMAMTIDAPAQPVPEIHEAYTERSEQPVNARIIVQPSVEATGATENGDLGWTVTVPSLEIGQGQMHLSLVLNEPEKSMLKSGTGATLVSATPVAFAVENRSPEARPDAVTEYTVYGHVPGMDDQPLHLNLDALFTEADPEQPLLYYLVADGVNYQRVGAFSVEGTELLIAPTAEEGTEVVTVRAYDPYGGSAEVRLIAHSVSLQDRLEAMRFGRPEQAETRVGEETKLTWRMPADRTADYRMAQGGIPQGEAAAQYPQLPDLAGALQVVSRVERVTFDSFRWEGDQLVLSATVAASKASVDVAVQPQVYWINGSLQWPLNNLFAGSDVTVSTVNTAPYIREAVEKTGAVTGYVKDVPVIIAKAPLPVPVNGAEQFTLSSLFNDQETDNSGLYYLILTNNPDVELLLNGAVLPTADSGETAATDEQPAAEEAPGQSQADPRWPDMENRQDWRRWTLSGEHCDGALALRAIRAGSADIEIYAWDEAVLSEPVALHVQADSYFRHILTVGGIVLAVLIAVFCVAEIIYQRSRPTFRQVVMEINHRPFTSIRGQLELKYYGKKNVNFMTLMAAAGMPPVEALSNELLSNIELKPLRKDCFRIVLNGDADKRVRIDFDGVKPDKNNTFSTRQRVSILAADRDEGIVICLTKQQ